MMRRLAFHKLYRPGGAAAPYRVVEVDGGGHPCGDAPLEGESAAVEWVGGIGLLLPESCRPRAGESIAAVLSGAAGWPAAGERLRLWAAVGLPAGADVAQPVSAYRPVV